MGLLRDCETNESFAHLLLHSAGTLSLDATLMSWVLTVLIMIFMFSAGLAIVSFPWMFMGKLSIIS